MDSSEICRKMEAFLASHPNAALPIVAAKLGLTREEIEQAVRESDLKSYDEFRQRCRLTQAFNQLGSEKIIPPGPWEKRSSPRRIIPGITVKYRIHGFWPFGGSFSGPCPLVDLSGGGLALLADSAPRPGKRVSLLLKSPEREQALCVEGNIVYTVATGVAGYRHRVGIQFLPFAEKRGCNSPRVLEILTQFERK